MVGSVGSVATKPSASGGSGLVSAREVRSTVRIDRERSAVIMRGSLMATCTTNPAMNTHAPK